MKIGDKTKWKWHSLSEHVEPNLQDTNATLFSRVCVRRKQTINCNYLNDILQDETGILFSKFGDNPKKFLVAWVNSCHFPCTFVDVGVCDNGRPTDTRYYRQDGFVMCRPWQCELGLTSTQTNSARQTSNRLLPLFSQLFVSTKSAICQNVTLYTEH